MDTMNHSTTDDQKSSRVLNSFVEEYGIILPLYSGKDSKHLHIYAGLTLQQMSEATTADIAYSTLKNIEAVSEHLNMSLEAVVSKALENVGWYKKVLAVANRSSAMVIPPTRHAQKFVTAKDKVTNKFFEGALPIGSKEIPVGTERRTSKKELTAVVSIDFEDLPNVFISKTITPYDREVHDAIVSLYVDGVIVLSKSSNAELGFIIKTAYPKAK